MTGGTNQSQGIPVYASLCVVPAIHDRTMLLFYHFIYLTNAAYYLDGPPIHACIPSVVCTGIIYTTGPSYGPLGGCDLLVPLSTESLVLAESASFVSSTTDTFSLRSSSASPGLSSTFLKQSFATINLIACERSDSVTWTSGSSKLRSNARREARLNGLCRGFGGPTTRRRDRTRCWATLVDASSFIRGRGFLRNVSVSSTEEGSA